MMRTQWGCQPDIEGLTFWARITYRGRVLVLLVLAFYGVAPRHSVQAAGPRHHIYENKDYGFAFHYQDNWRLDPASIGQRIVVLREVQGQGEVRVGVYTYDRPDDVALEDWVRPHDDHTEVRSQTKVHLNGHDAIRQEVSFHGDFTLYYFPRGRKVYFIQAYLAEKSLLPQLESLAESFRFTTPYEKDQELVPSLFLEHSNHAGPSPHIVEAAIPSGYRLPFIGSYPVTQGPDCMASHNDINSPKGAIDFGLNFGNEVRATEAGIVTTVQRSDVGYGNRVEISHDGGYLSLYGHFSSFAEVDGQEIRPGAYVQKGQVIGYTGSTGFSTGPHVHFEVRHNGGLVFLTEIPGLTWTYWESPNQPCQGTAVGPALETTPPEATIVYPAWGSIYSADGHFLDGTKIRIYAEATDLESGIARVALVGFYTANGQPEPQWHTITPEMIPDPNQANGYYYDWDTSDIPDQVDFHSQGTEAIRLEIKAYDGAGNVAHRQVPIGLLRRVGRGTLAPQKHIDAYLRANSFIKPGAMILNPFGTMEPYWWPSAGATYRVVRQDFQHGSIVHDECGLRKGGDHIFECPVGTSSPAAKAYFIPWPIMHLYEDALAHPEHYDDNYYLGAPLSDVFEAAPDPVSGETGIGMSFGQDTGTWLEGTRYSGRYSDDSLWQGDIYYSRLLNVAYEVHGAVFKKYHRLGGTGSALGFPRSHEIDAAQSPQGVTGRVSRFANGDIYWRRDSSKAYAVRNADGFRDAYESRSGTGGELGFPKSDREGNRQAFDGGCIILQDGVITILSGDACYLCEILPKGTLEDNKQTKAEGRSPQSASNCLEPNDSFPDAIDIPLGTELGVYCFVHSTTDVDFYKVFVEAGYTLEAHLYNLPANYDLYLYNSAQVLLTSSSQSGLADEILTSVVTTSGYYYLKIVSGTGESSTTQPYQLLTTAYPTAPGPDFVVSNLGASATQIKVDETVSFTLSILNQGQGASDISVVSIYEEDRSGGNAQVIGQQTLAPLSGSTSQTMLFYHTFAQPGQRQIRFVLDGNGQVSESDEGNNVYIAPITVCMKEDMDCNGNIALYDVQIVAEQWGKQLGESGYLADADLDFNGQVTIADLQRVTGRWGNTNTVVAYENPR